MIGEVTVAQAFDVAVAAERAAESLFQGLEAKFAQYPDVAAFWKQYASEEAAHAKWLEDLRARLTRLQLSEPVDSHTIGLLRTVAGFSVAQALLGVKNLEDAYELVSNIEYGETNAVFQFLLNHFEKDKQLREFLQAQLNKHIMRISIDFPVKYAGVQTRRAIQALEE